MTSLTIDLDQLSSAAKRAIYYAIIRKQAEVLNLSAQTFKTIVTERALASEAY